MRRAPKVGEFWSAKNDTEPDDRWIFKIVARERVGRSVFYIGLKCFWNSRSPVSGGGALAAIFGGNGKELAEDGFELVALAPRVV